MAVVEETKMIIMELL